MRLRCAIHYTTLPAESSCCPLQCIAVHFHPSKVLVLRSQTGITKAATAVTIRSVTFTMFNGLTRSYKLQPCCACPLRVTGHATSTETREYLRRVSIRHNAEYLYSRIWIFIPMDTSPDTGVTGSGSRYLLRVLVSDVTIRAHFRGLEQTENILISGRHKNNTKRETVEVQREKDC